MKPNDNVDGSAGLQKAIDLLRTRCSPSASYTKLSSITMPAGTINVSRQLWADADFLAFRGAGSGTGGTRIVFRPDANTRYDALTPDGSDWDEDGMTHGAGKGGWIWPGRGLFRVQSREVHPSYASDYASAPPNRKDLTLSLDKPLEYDVPVDSTSDGSQPIDGSVYASKAAPLVDPVLGVGFENFALTHDIPGLDRAGAKHNYGNMAPAEEMHGIVFKWAANSWVRGIRTEMTGSHPIVTEEAYRLQIVDNQLDGSWNKGKGGNGYFRGSRVWDSLYAGNTSRNPRHFTFQWSASGNVVVGNDFDSDLNLHGGWERNNLFELNTVTVPYQHRSGSCTANCGDEGGGGPDGSTWFPIW